MIALATGKSHKVARKQRDRWTDNQRRFNNASAGAVLRRRGAVRLLAGGQRGRRCVLIAREPKRPAKGQRRRR